MLVSGFEMAVGLAVGYFGGRWLGVHYGWEPWGSFLGAMVGLIAGAYLLIKEMNRADAQQRRERERERRGEKSGDDDVERNRP
jgi:F0F1-type ATP synthase assembly protein I